MAATTHPQLDQPTGDATPLDYYPVAAQVWILVYAHARELDMRRVRVVDKGTGQAVDTLVRCAELGDFTQAIAQRFWPDTVLM